MREYRIKIVGAQYAANPDYKYGDQETDTVRTNTIAMLNEINASRPLVVLLAEPTNSRNPQAVMARALGRKIGYVSDDELPLVRPWLLQSERGMLAVRIDRVEVRAHGYLFVSWSGQESVSVQQESESDWAMWQTEQPLLPPGEDQLAEDEAAFVLDEVLLPRLDEADVPMLETYLRIWMDGSRHDLSREARQRRSSLIERLEMAERTEIRQLAAELKHQRTAMCGRKMLMERTGQWWPGLVASEGAGRLWDRWRQETEGHPLTGLLRIDTMLRQLPGQLYMDIGHLEVMLSRLYYLRIPRRALQTILTLLVLRERTCRELGITMHPMTTNEYGIDPTERAGLTEEELKTAFQQFPAQLALGLYSNMATLLASSPTWQKCAPEIQRQILAKQEKQEDKQNQMLESMERAASKPSFSGDLVLVKETNIDKNYGPNIEQHGGTLTLPDGL